MTNWHKFSSVGPTSQHPAFHCIYLQISSLPWGDSLGFYVWPALGIWCDFQGPLNAHTGLVTFYIDSLGSFFSTSLLTWK
jgi:hypothetical protein